MQADDESILTNETLSKKSLMTIGKATEKAENTFDMAFQLAQRGHKNDFSQLANLSKNKEVMKRGFINGYINCLVENDLIKIQEGKKPNELH